MQVKKYYDAIRAAESKIEHDWPYIISVDSPNSKAGTVTEASKHEAARCIVEGTHRLATEDEIRAEHKRTEAQQAEFAEQERRRNKPQVLQLPAEFVDILGKRGR